ncbi:MAG: DUF1684 domain-containing protein [Chloroflexota bacterium]
MNRKSSQPDSSNSAQPPPGWLDLYDYRRRVAAMYRERARSLQAGEDEQVVLEKFRTTKNLLFADHPQSALTAEQRAGFAGLSYFPYNPDFRVTALLTSYSPSYSSSDEVILAADGPHTLPMRRAARLDFEIVGTPLQLTVYWLDVYGGGLFLPFSDATCPQESYGGGRYLFDTVKGSDFLQVNADGTLGTAPDDVAHGYAGGEVVLDFNYAYNPSCAYDWRWVCPLAPPENRLTLAVRAGEKKFA